MSEPELKTDGLKLIPQVFFDLIARVVPGGIGLAATMLLSGTKWVTWLEAVLGKASWAETPITIVLTFLGASYVLGQLVSPLAKLVRRIGEKRWSGQTPSAEEYNLLRLHYPKAGELCAKIRAECVMHNGITVVLCSAAIGYPVTHVPWGWGVESALIVGALCAAYRGWDTRKTFRKTVNEFAEATGVRRRKTP
jgi:hypothetical protein